MPTEPKPAPQDPDCDQPGDPGEAEGPAVERYLEDVEEQEEKQPHDD